MRSVASVCLSCLDSNFRRLSKQKLHFWYANTSLEYMIRYDITILTCAQKQTSSQLSLPQHRLTGPDTVLRYSGEKDNGDTSGSIREAPLGMLSGSLVVSDPPGNIGDKPGNAITQFPWSGLGKDTLQAAVPRSVSTLKICDAVG